MTEMNKAGNERPDVILSILKLTRALRRRPPHPAAGFPPAVERFLQVAGENDGASSRELCEAMDIRPSAMSEMISRMEGMGMIERTADTADKRVSRVSLTEKGRNSAAQIAGAKQAESDRMSACFSDEEAAQFCALCDRLSAYLESLPSDGCEQDFGPGHCPPRPPFGGPFPGPGMCPPPFGGPGDEGEDFGGPHHGHGGPHHGHGGPHRGHGGPHHGHGGPNGGPVDL